MSLLRLRGGYLYEHLPDMFPPFLTATECELWAIYYKENPPSIGCPMMGVK